MIRCYALVLVLLVCLSVSVNAAVIDFEDMYAGMDINSTSPIPAGYEGLSWSSSFRAMPVDYTTQVSGPGYANGVLGNVGGFTAGSAGYNQVVISSGQSFDFVDAAITSAWRINQDVWVTGYIGTQLLYHEVIYASYDMAYQFTFDFENIDKLVITPGLGGSNFYADDRGNHIIIDDINIVVPEPVTFCMLAVGGMFMLRRCR